MWRQTSRSADFQFGRPGGLPPQAFPLTIVSCFMTPRPRNHRDPSPRKQLAYHRIFREFRTWKGYRGGVAGDVWIHDLQTKRTVNITNNDASDLTRAGPLWGVSAAALARRKRSRPGSTGPRQNGEPRSARPVERRRGDRGRPGAVPPGPAG